MLPKEQFSALASIVHRYATGNPWSETKLTSVQDQLLSNGYITLRPQNNMFLLIPTARGWYLIKKDTPFPELGVETRSMGVPAKIRRFLPNNPQATFDDFLNGLAQPFIVNEPSEVTFHNFKMFMADKTFKYNDDWRIDDFRSANKYLYDTITEALPESNRITLYTLLDMIFYLFMIRDKQHRNGKT